MTQQHNHKLVLIAHSTVEKLTQQTSFLLWLSRFWHFVGQIMTVNNEPQVWQQHNRKGETFYLGHDPSTGQFVYCANEDEIRIWLDQLPY